jgi:hypothetical protein
MLTLIGPAAAHAQSRTIFAPAFAVSTVHDDNVFSRPEAVGDYMTQLRPSLQATYESPTKRLDAYGWFDMQMSARHSQLNSLAARRHAVVEGRVRTTPRVSVGLVGRYDRTENPEELLLESGILLERQRAERMELGPSMNYQLRPRTSMTARYTLTHESMADRFQENLHVTRVGVTRETSALTSWSASYLGRVFAGPSAPATHYSNAILAGWARRFSPSTRVSLTAGPRVTSYRGTTAEVLATYVRQMPGHRVSFDYWHGETIVLGIPGPVRVHSGSSKLGWTVRHNLEVGTHLGVAQNTTLEAARARVYHASIVSAWSPSETYILGVSYGIDVQRGDIRSVFLNEVPTRRGVFLVRLTVAPRFGRGVLPPDDGQFPPPVKGVIR